MIVALTVWLQGPVSPLGSPTSTCNEPFCSHPLRRTPLRKAWPCPLQESATPSDQPAPGRRSSPISDIPLRLRFASSPRGALIAQVDGVTQPLTGIDGSDGTRLGYCCEHALRRADTYSNPAL